VLDPEVQRRRRVTRCQPIQRRDDGQPQRAPLAERLQLRQRRTEGALIAVVTEPKQLQPVVGRGEAGRAPRTLTGVGYNRRRAPKMAAERPGDQGRARDKPVRLPRHRQVQRAQLRIIEQVIAEIRDHPPALKADQARCLDHGGAEGLADDHDVDLTLAQITRDRRGIAAPEVCED